MGIRRGRKEDHDVAALVLGSCMLNVRGKASIPSELAGSVVKAAQVLHKASPSTSIYAHVRKFDPFDNKHAFPLAFGDVMERDM